MNFKEKFENRYKDCLFRYRSISDNNYSALESDRLYFSTPIYFNDPYDNLVYANIQVITLDIAGNLKYGMDDYLKKLKKRDSLNAFIGTDMWNNPKKRNEILDIYFNNVYNAVDNIKKAIRSNSKIICFSEVYDSMLMWSHYADNHKGYVIIYKRDDLVKAKRFSTDNIQLNNHTKLEQVEYVSKQLDLTQEVEDYIRYNVLDNMGDVKVEYADIPQYKLRKAIIEKSREWMYEKEWRLIPRIINLYEESPLGYIECIPVGVILGAHCTGSDSDKLIDICKKKRIKVYRMCLNEFSPFKLDIGNEEDVSLV